jgi:hypothetical protein
MMIPHSLFAGLLIVVTAASASAQPSGNDNESRTTPSRPAESRAVDHSSSTIATTTKGTGEKSDSGPSRDSVRHSGSDNHAASSGSAADDRFRGARSGDRGMQSTGPGYETQSAVEGGVGKSSGHAATAQSGGKRPPP